MILTKASFSIPTKGDKIIKAMGSPKNARDEDKGDI